MTQLSDKLQHVGNLLRLARRIAILKAHESKAEAA